MSKILRISIFFYLVINITNISNSNENYFKEGLNFYNDKNYEDARFMFERSIVFNPKDSKS